MAARKLSNREVQSRFKAKMAAAGFIQCNIWVPRSAAPEFKIASDMIRENPKLRLGRMVDVETGKVVGLKVRSG